MNRLNSVNFYANMSNSPRPEKVKALVREYFQRLLNEKDLSVCDEMLSMEYIDHDAPPDALPGPQGAKEYVARFLEEYPDMHVEVEDLLAEGNKAAARLVWLGHHRGTGETFHQEGFVFLLDKSLLFYGAAYHRFIDPPLAEV